MRSDETALWEDILCLRVFLSRRLGSGDDKDGKVTHDLNSVNHVSIGKYWIPR